MISGWISTAAQDAIPWLDDYTGEMEIGSDTYQYEFTTVHGNECKVEFEEILTDRKGDTERRSWIFYLSDIDPSAIRFDARGKSIELTMETRNSQKFITYYEEGEFEEHTDEIEMYMNEVDLTRGFIEALREQIGNCDASRIAWENRQAAYDWLKEYVGEAVDDDIQWEQRFQAGEKPHLVRLSSTSTDDKGEQESFEYLFDLTDIEPSSVRLSVSGSSKYVEVPVRDGKDYIEVHSSGEKEYTDEVRIYASEIDVARQIVHALAYVIENTTVRRPEWSSYEEALGYVKEHLGEVKAGDDIYSHSLEFEDSPSGIVDLTVGETDSDGETEEMTYSFYLADMSDKLELEVSRDEITVEMETRNDRDFIKESEGDAVEGYGSSLEFHADGIDMARNLIKAWEYAIGQSEEDIAEFTTAEEVNGWMMQNLVPLYREGEKYEQEFWVDPEMENRIEFTQKLTEDDGEITENRYLIYPEDLVLDDLEINVSFGRLNVDLETGKFDYIKSFENGQLQDFEDEVEVFFSDPLVAKNFMAAIRFLKTDTSAVQPPVTGRDASLAFLMEHITDLELAEMKYEQLLEITDEDNCKLSFSRIESDDDGVSEKFVWEFIASDIDGGDSDFSVDGELVEVHLKTSGGEDLIKPYENGEVDDFVDEFTVYTGDILMAKRILQAFGALSEACGD